MSRKAESYLPFVKQAHGYYSAYPVYAPVIDTGGQVYNVKSYGALGNGVANDTAAIQSALDAAYAAGGGTVYLPAATYIVNPNPGLQVKTNVVLRGAGPASILKLINGSTRNDNIVKSESWTNSYVADLTIDGNRTNQAGTPGAYTYTQYGIYFGGTTNSGVQNVTVKNTTGVGIHMYNSTAAIVSSCFSSNNNYHGYEFEQTTECILSNSRGNNNLLHGVLTSPGEVAGTGAKGNSFIGNKFDNNSQYGIAMNAANADVSAFLNQGNTYLGNTIINNTQYGVNFYKQDKHTFSNNYISGNGYFGLYAFQSSNNVITGNMFVNNSQAGNGSYDEILLEGSSSGHAAVNNTVSGNTIIMSGSPKARYGVSEATSGDGGNTIYGNNIPTAGTSGRLNILSTDTSAVDRLNGVGVAANATLSGAQMGLDAPFGTGALRLYNANAGGNLQFVAPNGGLDMYMGGNNVFTVGSAGPTVPAGYRLVLPTTTPASAAAAGTAGTITWDSGFIYICTATNTWKRVAIATW